MIEASSALPSQLYGGEGNASYSMKSDTPVFELRMQGNSKRGRREENRLKQSEKNLKNIEYAPKIAGALQCNGSINSLRE